MEPNEINKKEECNCSCGTPVDFGNEIDTIWLKHENQRKSERIEELEERSEEIYRANDVLVTLLAQSEINKRDARNDAKMYAREMHKSKDVLRTIYSMCSDIVSADNPHEQLVVLFAKRIKSTIEENM